MTFEPYILLIKKLFLCDLSAVRPLLHSRYAEKPRGTPSRDPVCMLRAGLARLWFAPTAGITAWVGQLRSQPTLAIVCGFDPQDIPGVGTFYNFAQRLYPERTDPILRKPQKKPTDAGLYDLPVFIDLALAKTHDSVNAVKALDRLGKNLPEI